MKKSVTKQSTAVAKKLTAAERERVRDHERGHKDGREWVATCDPFDALEFVNSIGWDVDWRLRSPWTKCPLPDLKKRLKSEGRDYTHTFFLAVKDGFKADHSALVFLRHQEGVADGRRWASTYANDGQLARIADFAWRYWSRRIFVGPDPNPVELWSPAHELFSYLLVEPYPCDELDVEIEDCTEFREFWQPFVNEPMDKVMSNLKLYGLRAGHKLQDRHYIAGFIDGALGLSEKVGRRLSERTPTPLPNKGRSHNGY